MLHIHLRKLLKVIYLIYYAWKKGLVAKSVYDVKNGAFADYVKCIKESYDK